LRLQLFRLGLKFCGVGAKALCSRIGRCQVARQPVGLRGTLIREEKGDIFTLIGLLPDNVDLADPPNGPPTPDAARVLTRLALYIRINFDPEADIGVPQIRLLLPNAQVIEIGSLDGQIIETARSQAKERGNVLAGLVTRVSLAGFKPPVDGIVKVEIEMKDETYLAGTLTFKLKQA
jgi:hypothetical protein